MDTGNVDKASKKKLLTKRMPNTSNVNEMKRVKKLEKS